MLTLTDSCATIVKTMSTRPDANALRISHDETTAATFSLSVASSPAPDDQVVEQDGATVYLDAAAAQALDDKVLDAGVDDSGTLRFAVAQA
jgi:Fe-S cluster assembly iron-binding protein IscA